MSDPIDPIPAPADTEPASTPQGITLARVSWVITAAVFFGFGVVLVAEGYVGYAVVTLVTAIAAAINLLPPIDGD